MFVSGGRARRGAHPARDEQWYLGRASLARLGGRPCGQDLDSTGRTVYHLGAILDLAVRHEQPRACQHVGAILSQSEGRASGVKHGRALGKFRIAIREDEKGKMSG